MIFGENVQCTVYTPGNIVSWIYADDYEYLLFMLSFRNINNASCLLFVRAKRNSRRILSDLPFKDLQRYPLKLCLAQDFVDISIYMAGNWVQREYSAHCNLKSPDTQFSAVKMRVSTSPLSVERFKGYRCASDMHLYIYGRSFANTPTVSLSRFLSRWIWKKEEDCRRRKFMKFDIFRRLSKNGNNVLS